MRHIQNQPIKTKKAPPTMTELFLATELSYVNSIYKTLSCNSV